MSMDVKRNGDKLTITVTLDSKGYPSAKGNMVIYTSHGFQWFEDVGISLNIIKSKRA